MKNKFAFLTSQRFWAVVISAVIVYLEAKGYLGELERNLIITITGGFAVIRTVDRTAEVLSNTSPTVTVEKTDEVNIGSDMEK